MSSFLEKHKRQPKIYIDLPMSQYYPEGVLENGQTTSLPVFGMTATDEMMIKTPDALFNGEATKSVIKSCIPAILDPGRMPTMDIDFCLIAIRLATYSDTMSIEVTCPECKEKSEFDLSLQNYLEKYQNRTFNNKTNIEGLNFYFNPIDYNTMTQFSLDLYTIQRSLVGLPDEWSQDQKDAHVKQQLENSAKLNLELMLSYISLIEADDESEKDPQEISDFISNSDRKFFSEIKKHVEKIKNDFETPPTNVECTNCTHNFLTKVPMDYSNFFVQ